MKKLFDVLLQLCITFGLAFSMVLPLTILFNNIEDHFKPEGGYYDIFLVTYVLFCGVIGAFCGLLTTKILVWYNNKKSNQEK